MAFSLFGKKPTQPAPAIKRPAKSATAAKPAKGEEELGSLDFTLPGEIPVAREATRVQVEDVVHQVPAAIEQAAMLYSIEQTQQASQVLEAAIREGGLEGYERLAWGMLFELYQCLGRQPAYEALALEYAAKFETSPPAWMAPGTEEPARKQGPVGRPGVALSGALTAKAAEALQNLLKLADKHPTVRLDLAKITDADEAGCQELLETLRRLKKARKEFLLGGADKLAALLAKKLAVGEPRLEHGWLLLLELYQQLCNQEAFEDMAVNYAVTFEVSPPSWEPPRKAPPVEAGHEAEAEADEDACILEGDMIAVEPAAFGRIRTLAEEGSEVAVDASRLRRMDFVSAANLMNLVGELAAAGKKVRFRKVSHLVTALWEVIGLARVATIETRKA